MKQSLIFVLMLLFTVSFVQAEEYVSPAQNDGTYSLGFYNQGLTDFDTFSDSISSPSLFPMVSDLDGNGVTEIIALDGGTLRIWKTPSLNPSFKDGVSILFYDSSNRPTTMVIADLNDDGFKEIIIPSSGGVTFINYNGTTLRNAYNISLGLGGDGTGEIGIGCDDVTNRCLAYGSQSQAYAIAGTLRVATARLFNLTAIGNLTTILSTTGTNNHAVCLPHIPVVQVGDLLHDGVTKYVFSLLHVNSGGNTDEYKTYAFRGLGSNLSISGGIVFTDTNSGDVANSGANNNCRGDVTGNTFTAPLMHDFDGAVGDGLEIVFATMKDDNQYRVYSYEPNGVFIDDYPEFSFSAGTLVGNMFRADAFNVGGARNQFCVSAFITNSSEINYTNILCSNIGMIACGGLCDNIDYDINVTYNMSSTRDTPWSTLIGASQQDNTPYTGVGGTKDFDEVVTPYGVYRLATSFGNGVLSPIWTNFNLDSQRFGSVIAVDHTNVSRSNLIMLSRNNLFVFSDGFINSPAFITNFDSNPCLNQSWQQNTTVSIGLTADDINNDAVSCRAFLYYGTAFEQASNGGNFSEFLPAGTPFNFGFVANTTIGSAIIRAECRDVKNPTLFDTKEFTFSVTTGGRNFGDCQTHIGFETPITGNQTNTSLTPTTGNVITNLLTPLNVSTGLGFTILWLLLMGLTAIGGTIALIQNGLGGSLAFAVIGFVELMLLLVGAFLGFIGLGVIFTVVIIAAAIAVMVVRRVIVGGI